MRRAGQRQGQRGFSVAHLEGQLSSLFCECVYALKVCLPVRSVTGVGLPLSSGIAYQSGYGSTASSLCFLS